MEVVGATGSQLLMFPDAPDKIIEHDLQRRRAEAMQCVMRSLLSLAGKKSASGISRPVKKVLVTLYTERLIVVHPCATFSLHVQVVPL